MFKPTFLVITCFIILQQNVVQSATSTHNFGPNSATVTTGSHVCADGSSTDVTLSVDAVLNAKSTTRTSFGSNFDNRMRQLDTKPGDHKGHILASAFGGPAEVWNLAPQADHLNRKYKCRTSILNVWYDCEKFIREKLNEGTNLPVRVRITLDYENRNCRPTHWSIDAQTTRGGCVADHITNGPLPLGVCQRAK